MFATRTIIVSLLVGIIVTLIASLRPAIKATRVPADCRGPRGCDDAARPPIAASGPIASLVTLALGILLLVYGIFGSGLTIAARLAALGIGTLILFIGVSLNAKRAVRPLAGAARLRRARDSAERPARSPARTRCGTRAAPRRPRRRS